MLVCLKEDGMALTLSKESGVEAEILKDGLIRLRGKSGDYLSLSPQDLINLALLVLPQDELSPLAVPF